MYVIPSTELIVNPDGSIYHLHLKADELAETIITVGDPGRVQLVSNRFDTIELKRHNREFTTHTGQYRGKRISVVSTGIGTDNIDIVLNEIDALFNIDLKERRIKDELTTLNIVRIGSSGTMRSSIPIDAILVSEAAVGLDNLMHFYKSSNSDEWASFREAFVREWQYTGLSTTPYLAASTSDLIARALDNIPDMIKGITLTAPGFYAPQGRKLRAQSYISFLKDTIQSFEHEGRYFTNFEMETAGLYGLANTLGHQAVSFNAIIANRLTGEFSPDPAKMIDRLIDEVLELLVDQ